LREVNNANKKKRGGGEQITVVTSWLANSILPLDFALLLPSVKPATAYLMQDGQDWRQLTDTIKNNGIAGIALGRFIGIEPLERIAEQNLISVSDKNKNQLLR
jgi:hypothetical protein